MYSETGLILRSSFPNYYADVNHRYKWDAKKIKEARCLYRVPIVKALNIKREKVGLLLLQGKRIVEIIAPNK